MQEKIPYFVYFFKQILTKIFQYSSQNDLLRFRLVCKTWHGLVTSHLLLKDPIHRIVTHESDLAKLLNITRNSSSFPIQSFYIKIPSLAAPPHALFKTLSLPCIVSLKIIIESKHFPGAVKTIGMHMKSLKHLVICRIPEHSFEAIGCASMPRGVNSSCLPGKLPNLVSLTLRNAKPSRNFLATYDGAVVDLVRAAHGSLQCLEFWYWGLLTKILRETSFGGVKSLRVVGGKLSESDLIILIGKKKLKLDRFSARVDKGVGKQLVKEFLDKKVGGSGHLV